MHEASVHALTDEFDGTAHRDHPDDLHRLREYGAAYNDVLFQVLWIHRGIPSCFFAVEDVGRAAASHPRPPLTVCSSTDGQLEGRHPFVLDLAIYVISGDAHAFGDFVYVVPTQLARWDAVRNRYRSTIVTENRKEDSPGLVQPPAPIAIGVQ